MGKVPAVLHEGALVTEQPAIYIYVAALYPVGFKLVPATPAIQTSRPAFVRARAKDQALAEAQG